MTTDITIRPMIKEDGPRATIIMAWAFASKMPAMKKFSEEAVADFLHAGGLFDERNLKHHYVAVKDQEIVALMHLETKLGKRYKKTPNKQLLYMCRKFGFHRVLLSSISLIFLDNKLKKDEMLVDFIAVHPDNRGQGIGSQLLDYGESVAKKAQDIRRLTIGVIDENKGARRLYERKGFVVYKTSHRPFLQLFTGVKTSHMLQKFL